MTDHSIIFKASMVKALLREAREPGTGKTQTRRLLYSARRCRPDGVIPASAQILTYNDQSGVKRAYQPVDRVTDIDINEYHVLSGWHLRKTRDLLWVRENFAPRIGDDGKPDQNPRYVKFSADTAGSPSDPMDYHCWPKRWTPSIHMPRWASRLTLTITGIKIERAQSISATDAIAEGIRLGKFGFTFSEIDHPGTSWDTPKEAFQKLWMLVNGYEAWQRNPWVVALTFTVHETNIDKMPKAESIK